MSQPPAPTAAEHDGKIDNVIEKMAAVRAASGSGSGPANPEKKQWTYDEFQKVLDETPLFMRETPKDTKDNYVLEALKSLVFEGDGDEVGLNFKNHGNELYAQRSYRDAVDAYSQGLEAGPKDDALRISLLNNRAAANLAMKNYRAVLGDTSAIIAYAATEKKSPPAKAVYRAAQALVGLEQWDEATDAVDHGRKLKGEEDKKEWPTLAAQIEKGKRTVLERAERERRKVVMDGARRLAIVNHGLMVVNTPNPPDNPHPFDFDPDALPKVPLYPPEEAAGWVAPPVYTPLVFPVFLLYPQHNMSDLITHFHEDTSFDDQMAVIFPASASPSSPNPPWSDWDTKHEYYNSNLAVYVETQQRRLLKVGKDITLREVITKSHRSASANAPRDGIVLRDGLMSFVVLVKGTEEREWIANFKKVRDGGK